MKRITVLAKTENLGRIGAFVEETLAAVECAPKARMQLLLAAEEAFVNVARYAYDGGDGEVTITADISGDPPVATLTLTDAGTPYDPLQKPDPDTSLPAESRPIGGLGVYMMKRNVDTARYRYENGRNVLTLIKKLDRQPTDAGD